MEVLSFKKRVLNHSKMFLTMSAGFLVGILLFVYLIFRATEHAFFGNLDGMFIFTLLTFVSGLILLLKSIAVKFQVATFLTLAVKIG